MRDRIGSRGVGPAACVLLLAGCNRHQSTLAPFGEEAAGIAGLALAMTAGAVAIFLAVLLLIAWAVRAPEGRLGLPGGERLILWAGGVAPAVALLALLGGSLPLMRPRSVAPGDLAVTVVGRQFWWDVRYRVPGAPPVAAANEIRVPVGRTVVIALGGADVVHSFWVPGLAGKTDMIPGRTNRMVVRATRTGVFRGQCTEFCGLSHALMAFDVVAMAPVDFDRWLAGQRRPAAIVAHPGARAFAAYGCGGCHAIRGTGEGGAIGPDLTHVGGRRTIGAGLMAATQANLARFIRHPEAAKPGVRMPAFAHMPEADARAIAGYLKALQ